MKTMTVFTDAYSGKKVAVRTHEVREVHEHNRKETDVVVTTWETESTPLKTIRVVGDFEETIAKIEACT